MSDNNSNEISRWTNDQIAKSQFFHKKLHEWKLLEIVDELEDIDGEKLECASCGKTFSIVSGDPISDPEAGPLTIYDVTEEDGKLYLNL